MTHALLTSSNWLSACLSIVSVYYLRTTVVFALVDSGTERGQHLDLALSVWYSLIHSWFLFTHMSS